MSNVNISISFTKVVREIYLDWVNNFLTVQRFAEYYGISEDFAIELIGEGRRLHENAVQEYNESFNFKEE
jgi:hypothetical protein